MKKRELIISLLLLIALVLSGCAAPEVTEAVNRLTEEERTGTSRVVVNGPNWSVEYRTVTDWGTGFNGEIKITNTGTKSISQWSLTFDWDSEIKSIWDAKLVSSTAGSYLIEAPSWRPTIEAGGSVKIGINGGGPLTGNALANVDFTGWGVVGAGYESYDEFVANLRAALKNFILDPYIVTISPIQGSDRYSVGIHYDHLKPRPTLMGMLSSCSFTFQRTKSDLVKVDASSYQASYQGIYNPGIDAPLMLEGVRLIAKENVITSKTMGQIIQVLPYRQTKDKIYVFFNNAQGTTMVIERTSSGEVKIR